MKYTARYAHLESLPKYRLGDKIKRGDVVGRMGNTGKSTGAHLHIDVVEGWQRQLYRLSEMASGKPRPHQWQLNYFIDYELFGIAPVITTYYNDPDYGGPHPAYDVVPVDRKETDEHYNIIWNRSKEGEVLGLGFDNGYGFYILIGYEA